MSLAPIDPTLGGDPRIDVLLDPTADPASPSAPWISLMADVLVEPGITAARGIAGTSPTDRVCQPGTLSFTLDNGVSNSARTASYYSPTHPSCRVGWREGCPVRLVAVAAGTEYPLWKGRIRTIDPTPGRTPMTAAVLAQDAAADLSTAIVPSIAPQINQSEVDLLNAVIAALPAGAAPPVLFDAALDSYPFAFINAGNNAIALSLITDAIMSSAGTAFIDAQGRLRYRNRHVQAGTDSTLTILDDMLWYGGPGFAGGSSLKNVFNHFRTTVHPKTQTPAVVLFHNTATIQLDPNTPFEVWDNYSDPNNRDNLVGGFNFTPLAAGTDYTANGAQDGSGIDRTADLQIAITPFVASAKSVLTNIGATTLFVTMRQLRGTAIFDYTPVTMDSFIATNYGDRVASIDLPFQTSALIGQNLGDFFLAQYADRARAGEELVFLPQRTLALLQTTLATDISDVVTASEHTSGVENIEYDIRGVTYTYTRLRNGNLLTVRYRIVPHANGAGAIGAWTFDHPKYGLLDTGTAFGFA